MRVRYAYTDHMPEREGNRPCVALHLVGDIHQAYIRRSYSPLSILKATGAGKQLAGSDLKQLLPATRT